MRCARGSASGIRGAGYATPMSEGVNIGSSIAARIRSFERTRFSTDVLVPFLVARAVIFVVGFSGSLLLPRRPVFVSDAIAIVDVLLRWDALSYLDVAERGYGNDADGFFPLYPWLVRGVGLVMPLPYAAVLVANVAALIALGLLRRLVEADYGRFVARRAVALAVIFPTSFFLSCAYAESTYLACVIGVFVAARERRIGLATIAVFLACLARPQGFFVATIPFVLAWTFGERSRRSIPWFVLGAVPALAALLAVHQVSSGDPFGFVHAESVQSLGVFWRSRSQPPPPLLDVLVSEGIGSNFVRRILNLASVGLVATASFVHARRRRIDLAAGAFLSLAVPLAFQRTLFDAASMARYAALAFPIYPLLAQGTASRGARRFVDLAFPTMQVVLFIAYAEWIWAE